MSPVRAAPLYARIELPPLQGSSDCHRANPGLHPGLWAKGRAFSPLVERLQPTENIRAESIHTIGARVERLPPTENIRAGFISSIGARVERLLPTENIRAGFISSIGARVGRLLPTENPTHSRSTRTPTDSMPWSKPARMRWLMRISPRCPVRNEWRANGCSSW